MTLPAAHSAEVSCVLPTRDRAGMVGSAIESALGQTPVPEIVVVDDGSSDDTRAVLAGFGPRIRVVATAGVGVAAARNAGLHAARGRFVAFLDSDDRWRADKIATQLALMQAEPDVALSFTDYTVSERDAAGGWRVTTTRAHTGELTLGRLLERNFIGTLTVMAKRDVLLALGGFETSLVRGSDYDLWLRVRRAHPIARVPAVLADYAWHAASLTGASLRRNRENHVDVLRRLYAADPDIFAAGGVEPAALIARAVERVAAT